MIVQTLRELPEEELERMERLVQEATDGPWLSYVVGRDAAADWNRVELGVCNELGSFHSIQLVGGTIADQDFIASARQDVPRLLLEVRALKARLQSLRMMHDRQPLQAIMSFADTQAPAVAAVVRS